MAEKADAEKARAVAGEKQLRAEAAGAEVCEGVRVQAVERDGDAMCVSTGDKRYSAPLVIGAGGHHCPVSRAFGEVSAEETVVVTRESETDLGAQCLRGLTMRHGTPELFAEPDFRGYGWYFTKGDFLNLGIGCLGTGKDLHRRCTAMVERLRAAGRLPVALASGSRSPVRAGSSGGRAGRAETGQWRHHGGPIPRSTEDCRASHRAARWAVAARV